MSDGLNKVMLIGNLGADPELRATSGGDAVLKLRLATTESYLDKNKVKQERTEWHSVVIWGKRAEALSKFLSKGSRLYIEGGIRTSSYEKDGEKKFRTEVNASNIILLGGGDGGGKNESRQSSGSSGGSKKSDNPFDDGDDFDPFK
jgi:single-strand DNA-binding protein